jgi:hypothetical protein
MLGTVYSRDVDLTEDKVRNQPLPLPLSAVEKGYSTLITFSLNTRGEEKNRQYNKIFDLILSSGL